MLFLAIKKKDRGNHFPKIIYNLEVWPTMGY